MDQHDPEPHAEKTAEQLAALANSLERHIADLGRELETVRKELRRRTPKETLAAISIEPGGPSPALQLSYRSASVGAAQTGAIGDSYADEARLYGFRMALAATLGLVAVVILCIVAAMV
ncbi:MAG: hypothetical protein JWN51_1980 [Phycisphaerales bacterium]|jgi:hypothetical protein|nr:hypothetical protein [Phycisphaerales bacterium]